MSVKIMKKKIALCLVFCLLAGLPGCGGEKEQEPAALTSADIELIEPVNSVSNTEAAAYRTLYDYKIISGYVCPYVQEYALSIDARLSEYLVVPGDRVQKGAPLLQADEEALLDEIEAARDELDKLALDYETGQKDYALVTSDIREEIEGYEEEIAELEEELADARRYVREESDLLYWKDAIARLELAIEACGLRIEQNELKAAHATQIYELDAAYQNDRIEQLQQQIDRYTLYSGMSGTVVSVGMLQEGEYMSAGTPLVAVADDSQTIFRCDYVSKEDVKRCDDLYVVINGERYEVTYQPYTTAEYNKLKSQNGSVYSSFVIDDPEGNVKTGDFAVLTMVYTKCDGVLTVPKTAVRRDEAGHYVYCVVDGESVETRVRTGESDGVYTEITNGLSEGDLIMLTENVAYGTNTVTVGRGDFCSSFGANGTISYPIINVVTNPVEYGTTYLVKYHVEMFSSVRAGDVIATVRVQGDEAELYDMQLKWTRLNERLNDLLVERTEKEIEFAKEYEYEDSERKEIELEIRALNKEIERQEKEIEDLTERMAELQSSYAVTEICAPTGGTVIWVKDLPENSIIPFESEIAYVADHSEIFLSVIDEQRQLALGSRIAVEYTGREGQACTAEGVVVTAPPSLLSARLVSGDTYIQLPPDVIAQMPPLKQNELGYLVWNTYRTSAVIREMKNVLIVPKSAVWEVSGRTYVFIRQADGTVKAQSFIAGGFDAHNYWVLEGLEEGMNLCSE